MSMPAQEVRRRDDLRLEVLLDRRRAAHHLGLAREDARERLRVGHLVEAPAARRPQIIRSSVSSIAAAEADRRHGDPLGRHRLHEIADAVLRRLAVGEQDDVLLLARAST